MKKILIFLLIALMGCTEMLNQVPFENPLPDNFFANEDEANQGVVAVYAKWTESSNVLYYRNMLGFELLSDNAWDPAEDQVYGDWTFLINSPDNAGVAHFYDALYELINRANVALTYISEMQFVNDPGDARRNNLLGQARFNRAYAYFLLTLIYGDVPLIKELQENPAGTFVAKSTASEIYDFVIEDLIQAKSELPVIQAQKGRITKGAAGGMLAKVYLFGADELGKKEWYALAKKEAKEVMDSNQYGLMDTDNPEADFRSLFEPAGKNCKEILFSIQHSLGGGYSEEVCMIVNAFQPRMLSPINGSLNGFGNVCFYPEIGAPSYWETGDARRGLTLWETGEKTYYNHTYDQAKFNRNLIRPDAYGCQKYYWYDPATKNPTNSSFNWPVLRYADLLLIHAEADLMDDGNLSSEGLASYNTVRDRAGLAAKTSATREQILKERQLELMGELHRWWDLMRTKTAEAAFAKLKYTDKAGFIAARHYKFPLPTNALERNEALVQNPAWAGVGEEE